MRIILALGLLTALAGCAGRNVHVPSTPEVNAIEPGYLDLRAGWRLVVVAPILNSGGYRLPSLQEKGNEDLGHLSAGPDFVGMKPTLTPWLKAETVFNCSFVRRRL
jgi:hypothetical protein